MAVEIVNEQLRRLWELALLLERVACQRACAVRGWMRGKGLDATRQLGQRFRRLAQRQQGLAQSYESFRLTLLRILPQKVAIDGGRLLVSLSAQVVAGGLREV